MTSLLTQYADQTPPGERQALATINEQLELGKRLAALIQVRGKRDHEVPILPLPVRIFVDEAVRLVREGRSLDELPPSLPEAYFRYLEQINPKTVGARNAMTDEAMLKASKLLGKLATESDFIPKEFSETRRAAACKRPGGLIRRSSIPSSACSTTESLPKRDRGASTGFDSNSTR
jgi:hypothetical protein